MREDGGKWGLPSLSVGFVSLTFGAAFDVLFHFASHFGPPQMLPDQLRSPRDARVPHRGGIVILTDKVSPLVWFCGDDFAVILPPFSLDFDEIMSVYPRFKGAFVLRGKCHKSSDEEFFGKDNDVFVIPFSLIVICLPR